MIYTGVFHPDLTHYTTRFPDLLTASEKDLYEFGRGWERLLGLWVNSTYLLMHCPADRVAVCGLSGRKVLSAHPAYDQWKESMSPGEFYSHTGYEWADR